MARWRRRSNTTSPGLPRRNPANGWLSPRVPAFHRRRPLRPQRPRQRSRFLGSASICYSGARRSALRAPFRLAQYADTVAEFGGVLVLFRGDGVVELALQFL